MRFQAALSVLLALLPACPAVAQTQAQQDRLNLFGKYIVTSAVCDRLGMKVDEDISGKAEAALIIETADWGVNRAEVDRLMNEAAGRQGAILRTDLGGAAEGAKTEAQLRNVSRVILPYAETCLAASQDTIFSKLIVAPPGYQPAAAAQAFADQMLEAGGLASWQSTRIQARGDMMTLAGTCRQKIGAARSDALMQEFGQATDPRERRYYNRSFDRGIQDDDPSWTLDRCNRAITRIRVKAGG